MASVTATTKINASKEAVWAVLANIGAISNWNPGVSKSYVTSDRARGDGAERHCDLGTKGDYLKERALDWREGEGFKIEVYDTNLPLKRNVVTFSLQSDGEGTVVSVSPDYELKFGPIGVVMDRLCARAQLRKGMADLLAGLKYHVETGELVGDKVPTA